MIIKEFNPQNIEPSCSWIILGPPGSGKSTFVENLVKLNRHKYPICRIITSVPTAHERWCKLAPPIMVHSVFNFDRENKFIERQKKLSVKKGQGKFCVYVMDDIDISKHKFRDPFFNLLFKQGSRHWCMLTILVNQYALEFPPDVRSAATYIAIFKYTSNVDRKKLYNNYGGDSIFKSYQDFNNILDNFTGNKKCLILKQSSDDPSSSVFYYQCNPTGNNWRFGCGETWEWSKVRCDENKKYLIE